MQLYKSMCIYLVKYGIPGPPPLLPSPQINYWNGGVGRDSVQIDMAPVSYNLELPIPLKDLDS